MFDAIVRSIFEPGVSPKLLLAVNLIFGVLLLTGVLILGFINFSVHVLALTILALALIVSINWFVHEMAVEREEESKKQS